MTIDIRLDLGWFLAVFSMLLLFGIAYNWAVAKMGRRLEGFTSLAVAFGVLGTLTLIAVLSWQVAAICLAGFIASGLPMVAGSVTRYMQRREDARKAMISEARDDE